MIKSFFTLHAYFIANVAIMLSYCLARFIIELPLFKQGMQQQYKLRLARFCFIFSISLFLIMPSLVNVFSLEHSNLEFKPIIHHASMSFLRHHEVVATEIATVHNMSDELSLNKVLFSFWIIGFILYSVKFMYALNSLRVLRLNAFCRHRINRVQVLFSSATEVPFCWSSLRQHFIAIPNAFLEKPEDMRLAIRHELQHIRQRDTQWLYFMMLIKLLCFWNPFLKLWMNWFNELQEFACDEGVILRRKTLPSEYAQCLLNTASHSVHAHLLNRSVLAINGTSKSILYRRVNMLFSYQHHKNTLRLIVAYSLSFFCLTTVAYALNGSSASAPLTQQEISSLIKESNVASPFQVSATPEVIAKINEIRANKKTKQFMLAALTRMKMYKPYLHEQLKKNGMPFDLVVIPLIESGYRPLPESENIVQGAGLWQIIPSTATKLGLIVQPEKDDRLNTQLSTQAALEYFRLLYAQFQNWKLAVLAYNIGEDEVARLIKANASRDAWVLARSAHVPEKSRTEILNYLAMFDASVIIMHNPSLITQ